jgi:hypothetical protein
VTFGSDSRLERIEESAFSGSGSKSILIPSSVVVLGERSFRECASLESVTFGSGSQLEQVKEYAFRESFRGSRSLKSVAFESGSRLERIEESAFQGSRLKSILIPRHSLRVDWHLLRFHRLLLFWANSVSQSATYLNQ